MMAKATARPTTSLQLASRTWLTEVGIMFRWPWKKPRKAATRHIRNALGPRQAMAAQASGCSWNTARGLAKQVIRMPKGMPRERKMVWAVL